MFPPRRHGSRDDKVRAQSKPDGAEYPVGCELKRSDVIEATGVPGNFGMPVVVLVQPVHGEVLLNQR